MIVVGVESQHWNTNEIYTAKQHIKKRNGPNDSWDLPQKMNVFLYI